MGTQSVGHGEARAMTIDEIEKLRQQLQEKIDASKDIDSRRKMGQFSTPHVLSRQIVSETSPYLKGRGRKLRMLETSMGIGSFVASTMMVMSGRIKEICGYELDADFYDAAAKIWDGQPVNVVHEDFTKAKPNPIYDFVISNPPYVRHHALGAAEKVRLQKYVHDALGIRISGLAGLYCHFMLLSYLWMKPGAVGAWLIPSEWMTVNYGSALREFLTRKVRILRIHRFDAEDVRFSDALVSSCVVWFKKVNPVDEEVRFTFGPDIENPARESHVRLANLCESNKWPPQNRRQSTVSKLGEHFVIRRGIATGDNSYFVLPEEAAKKLQIPKRFLKPMLPSPRYLTVDRVMSDAQGVPSNAIRQFLFDCTGVSESDLPDAVRHYLEFGANTTGKKKLCSSRNVWYEQEQRQPTHFLCSYMGRGDGIASPVRFILNDSKAIAANSFLMLYPKDSLKEILMTSKGSEEEVWRILAGIPPSDIKACGRSYGGGLYKVEPKELANVPCGALSDWIREHS